MSEANQYLLRAPFSLQKITWNPDTKTVIYRSRRSWPTKRNFEVFTATDFLAAAIEHIPPKGQQTIRYYGIYSNKSRGLARPTASLVQPPSEKPPEKPQPEIPLIPAPPKATARAMRPLWRDLILSVWGADPLKCPSCQGIMKRVETIVRPGEVEFFLRLLGLWEGLISLPPPPEPPFDIEKRRGIGGVLDAGESRSPQGEPAKWGGRIKPSSPSNLLGRPSVPGFQPTKTNPQPTRPNSGTKPPAQAGKPRKSISETDALSSSNTPDDQGHRLEATRQNYPNPAAKNFLGKEVGDGMLTCRQNSP